MIEQGRRFVVFLPECLTVSYVQTEFPGLLEFTNRQIRITKLYRPQIWGIAFATHSLYCITLLLGSFLWLSLLVASRPAFHIATLLILPLLLSAIRGAIRVIAVTEALPASRKQIMSQSWIYIVLTLFVPFLYLINFISSLIGRRITWRGITYELISTEQIQILGR